MNDQNEIDCALDADTRRAFTSLLWPLLGFLLYVSVWCVAQAQTITAPSRISPYDWACLDASGAVLSNHQRFDTAFVACYNNPQGAEIVGGRYKLARAIPQPVPCPAKPGDESRPQSCPTGTTGSWTQTRVYASAPAPACWVAGEWLPTSAPAGACVTPPPPTAPVLTASIAPNQTNPSNSNVTLTWTAIPGTTMYEVHRSTGNCNNLVFFADEPTTTYKALNQPPGLTWCYRVRAWKPDPAGPYSQNVTVTTPSAPPPPANGTAKLEWTAPSVNTDGTPAALAGYRIDYGPVGPAGPGLNQSVEVRNATAVTYTLTGLAAGQWAFTVSAFDTAGRYSLPTNIVTKAVP